MVEFRLSPSLATPQSAVEHSPSIEKHILLKMFYVINEKINITTQGR